MESGGALAVVRSVAQRALRDIVALFAPGERLFQHQRARESEASAKEVAEFIAQRQLEVLERLTAAVRDNARDQAKIDALLDEYFALAAKRVALAEGDHDNA